MKIKVKITRKENANLLGVSVGSTATIDFEQYVATVVASEISNAPIEACKAQAVAARTYAMYQGVLDGKAISDASSSAQAYRAARYDNTNYPNALKGAQLTEGQVLFYKNKPISAVFSHSNGGKTTSSKERWGTEHSYLPAQKDPQDAATHLSKRGHGVGMSQMGAIYAANQGVNYKDILAFYYPTTTLKGNYGKTEIIESDIIDSSLDALLSDIYDCLIQLQKLLGAK